MLSSIKRVDNRVEERIATAAITSPAFLAELRMLYRDYMLRVPYVRRVVGWCLEYYEEYKEAPGRHIGDLFHINEETLKEEEAESIETLLEKLSDDFDSEGLNVPFILDETRKHLQFRHYEHMITEGRRLLASGNVDGVRDLISGSDLLSDNLSGVFNPLDPDTIDWYEQWREEGVGELFSFDGCLGDLFGPLRRGWLVGFMGPMKRGKTNWLLELSVQGAYNKKNVLFVSFEMPKEDLLERIYKRLTGLPNSRHKYVYPVFDCVRNQFGDCVKKKRVGKGSLFNAEDFPDSDDKEDFDIFKHIIPMDDYERVVGYRPCSACRGTSDYQISIWYNEVRHPASMTVANIRKKSRELLEKICGDRLRFISFPSFSAGMREVMSVADSLSSGGFIPDVIVCDYADIMDPKSHFREQRHNIDQVWKDLKRMAGERRCLVVTATQSNRGSISKKIVEQEDTGEDIRKLAHVDIMASLNQTKQEKGLNIMRIGMVVHRHKKFIEDRQIMILQQLDIGQPALDFESF